MSAKKFSIGIDLGTTNSVISYRELEQENAQLGLLDIPQLVDGATVERRKSLASFLYIAAEHELGNATFSLPWSDAESPHVVGEIARRRSAELERGVCLVGPHRDDLELRLGDQLAKGFASHGESWSMALALRLGAYELLRTDGTDPVLLLDDVFAELDSARRRALADVAQSAEQVLVTAAVPDDIPQDWDGTRINVVMRDDEGGRISVVDA